MARAIVAGCTTPPYDEDRNRLLRTMGNPDDFRPIIRDSAFVPEPGDAFLLCSDGFWEYVLEEEMAAFLARSGSAENWLQTMEALIMKRAPGDHDNYPAVALRGMK